MRKDSLVGKMACMLNTETELLPQRPLLELIGDQRVLIENHCGICEYSTGQITVRVKKAWIYICGKNLSISFISRERLVIVGCIDTIKLERGH